jgi:phosphoglycolate phosphatase
VYPGITELLIALYQRSYKLCIVTLKNKDDAEKIARHFSFDGLIQGIFGPNVDEYPKNKTPLIKSVMADFKLAPDETKMIGDRQEDVVSGKLNGTRTIGVTYGYGSEAEIIGAAPDYICRRPDEIQGAIEAASLLNLDIDAG